MGTMSNIGDDWSPSSDFYMNKKDAELHLKSNYSNPAHPLAFIGIDKIYKFYNGLLSKQSIKQVLSSKEVYSLIKQEKSNPRNIWTPIISFHYLDLVQADLIDISSISESNLEIKFLLCVIDCFSRYLWIRALPNKKAESVLEGLHVIFSSMEYLPNNLTTDMGGEFVNKSVKTFLKKMKIKFYISVSENKCSLIEIAQKSIQRRIYSYMIHNESLEYLNIIPHVTHAYNNSLHRTISLTPNQAKKSENFQQVQAINFKKFHKLKRVKIKPKYKLGDIVRVSIDKQKTRFARSYNIQNTYPKYEIYKISTKNSVHAKYFLKHVSSDKLIKNGYFYDWQLTISTSGTFRGTVIKTRQRRGKKEFLFSYKGYPSEFDEWKTAQEITLLNKN